MKIKLLPLVGLALLLQACATMSPDYEEPTVTLTSFRAINSEGMTPSFEVGLRIINPNRNDLAIQGIVYTIALEGHEVVKGVGKDYPVVEAYSQQDITLLASVNLLSGLRLIGDLMRAESGALRYEFTAKLDPGGFYPSIRVSESGQLDLGASPR
ncbi:MAG: LEA type 2 family protein [Lysobacterales bacterium]